MKFYKRKTLDTHNPMDNGFAQLANGNLVTNSVSSIELPSGTTGDRPSDAVDGQLRYNQDLKEAEGRINGVWERIRTVRPATIVVQNLGVGDYVSSVFGPLNPDYLESYIKGSANVMVYVDNVYQIPELNYTLGSVNSETFQIPTAQEAAINDTFLVLDSIANVRAGMGVEAVGSSAITSGTTIVTVVTSSNLIELSQPITGIIPIGTTINLTLFDGVYIVFTGPVPAKPVVAILGFDGYFPPA